jgi:fused signal recognition particle receptor
LFGFLKKKLQEGIDKISKVITEKEEEKIEEAVEEVKQEDVLISESKEELIEEVEKEIEKPAEKIEVLEIKEEPKVEVKEEIKQEVKEEPKVEAKEEVEEVKSEVTVSEKSEEKLVEDLKKFEEKLEAIEKVFEKGQVPEQFVLYQPKVEEPKLEVKEEIEPEVIEEPKLEVKEEAKPVIAEPEVKEEPKPIFVEEEEDEIEPKEEPKPFIAEQIMIEPEVAKPAVTEHVEAEPEIAKPVVEEPKIEKKKGFLGLLRRKPKKEEPKPVPIEAVPEVKEVKMEEPKSEAKEDVGLLEKIKKKITEKKIEEEDIRVTLNEIEMGLISSDVAVEAAHKIVEDLRTNLVGKFIKKGEIEKVIKESIRKSMLEILDVPSFDIIEKSKAKKPLLIVFLGFNGVGKTTSIARIGHLLKISGISCVFAAGDSWRAAAIEQLEEHGKNLGIDVIKHNYGADPAAVIFDAVNHAKSKGVDVILADTAGRSHSNANLMDELKKIIKVNKPDLKILVLDALTGNDIYDQCKLFNDAVGVDGMILTKADVYEKGGAALAASHTINKPIIYMGIGQNYGDLEKFDPKKIVDKLIE